MLASDKFNSILRDLGHTRTSFARRIGLRPEQISRFFPPAGKPPMRPGMSTVLRIVAASRGRISLNDLQPMNAPVSPKRCPFCGEEGYRAGNVAEAFAAFAGTLCLPESRVRTANTQHKEETRDRACSRIQGCVMAWTEDRVAFIRAQYLDGRKSAGEIAALLGDVTREAVCGKLYRIGARREGPPVRQAKAPRLKAAASANPRRTSTLRSGPAFSSKPFDEMPIENAIPFLEAAAEDCRWITGQRDGGLSVCGRRKSRGAFCADHAAMAYIGQPKRSRSQNRRCRSGAASADPFE
jgi:GcrA cell cycle regulator